MARAGVTYADDGRITGSVYCAQDDDLARHPNVMEVPCDHAALTDPRRWRVTLTAEGPTLERAGV